MGSLTSAYPFHPPDAPLPLLALLPLTPSPPYLAGIRHRDGDGVKEGLGGHRVPELLGARCQYRGQAVAASGDGLEALGPMVHGVEGSDVGQERL